MAIDPMGTNLIHRGVEQKVVSLPMMSVGLRFSREPEYSLHVEREDICVVCGSIFEHPFDRGSNLASELLHGFRKEGAGIFSDCHGQFSAAVFLSGRLVLVRDSAGNSPIAYAVAGGKVYFATEPKAVIVSAGIDRRLRPDALAQYLSLSYIPAPRTALEKMNQVVAGSCVEFTFNDGGVVESCQSFFDFERYEHPYDTAFEPETDARAAGWVRRTQDLVHQAIVDRLPPKGQVASFLSGGLDSSIVTAELARLCPERLTVYAIHFGENYPNELEFAREVAKRIDVNLEEVEMDPKMMAAELPRVIRHLDEPIGDPITAPNFLISQLASEFSDYAFNGEGGDPLFGGPKTIPMLLQHWYSVPSDARNRERWYLESYRRAYEEVFRLMDLDFASCIEPVRDLEGLFRPFFEQEPPRLFLNKLMSINIRMKGANLILPKVDRMYGAHGLQACNPLFDSRLIELSFAMPGRMKFHRGIEKWVLKEAYRGWLPKSVIDRPKSGMRVPVHFWFEKELKRLSRRILDKDVLKKSGIWNYARVKQLLDYNIEEGHGRYGLRLWMLITFELWRRLVINREEF
ncbi:MAG: asparagine synthase-related protein [Verrucomicrobiota bacterium]